MSHIQPIEIPSAHQEAMERIKYHILAGGLRPGDALPTEAQLGGQLGVSRAIVREALKSLESLGIVESRRGEGRYVRDFNFDAILDNLGYSMLYHIDDLVEMLEIRQRLELSYIEDAVMHMDESTLGSLRSILNELRAKEDAGVQMKSMWREDLRFHRLMYAPTHNGTLLKILDVFWKALGSLQDREIISSETRISKFIDDHMVLLQALERQDAPGAGELMQSHMNDSRERVRQARTNRNSHEGV